MGYVWQRWLADEFRAAGLTVVEVEGWKNRGRPASTGAFEPEHGVTVHHTGVTSSRSNPGPTLKTLIVGRPDLPGPLCQWTVRHDGVVVVIAAGRANHAGRVGKSAPGMPAGTDGNARALGDEVDTDGSQPLTPAQVHSIAVTNAVALKHHRNAPKRVHRHADISDTGKWDLGSRSTALLRRDATAVNFKEEDDEVSWTEKIPVIGVDKEIAARNMLQQAHNRSGEARKNAAQALGHAKRAEAVSVANGKKLDVLLSRTLTPAQREEAMQRITAELAEALSVIDIQINAEVSASRREEEE